MRDAGESGDLTRLLLRIRSFDDREEAERLFTAVYDELRRTARELMARESQDHTLQPTDLVHEAYVRLVQNDRVTWQNRAHFFGIAARAMRRVLVEHARSRARIKRGGGMTRVTLGDKLGEGRERICEVLDLHAALDKLAGLDPRMSQVVELKAFAGLETREIAHVLSVSSRTVESDWTFARLWIARELDPNA